tara:strand:- start:81 stop:1013 length:933 start_codon:yes stop_codon:yes gene_type:complete
MKYIVTGGCGFLGSHLCRKLVNMGHFVYCLDNLYTGNINNIRDLKNKNKFKFINHDITEPIKIYCDGIFNLACPASPVSYQANPIKTIKTCFIGTLNMLELAKKLNVKFFQASTSEIYGDPNIHPQKTDYWGNVNPIGIRSCYDEGKRSAETLCMDFNRLYGLPIKIGRIFNTYGPNMAENDGRVVSNFITQCLNNNDITIYGDGTQTRSFCYVSDLIEVIFRFFKSNNKLVGPLNLGNNREYSVKNTALLIRKMTKSGSKIIYKELPKDDPVKRKPDLKLTKKYLNWMPEVSLKIGLSNTIEYFEGLKH